MFAFGQAIKRLLPRALTNPGVAPGKICLGDLEVKHRLALGLVFGCDNLLRGFFIDCFEAGAIPSLGIHAIKGASTAAATNQTVTCFHHFFHATAKINETVPELLASTRRVNADYANSCGVPKLVSV